MNKIMYERQLGLIDMKKLSKAGVTIIGAGSVGSFTALTLAKMGVKKIDVYDEDGVEEHNIPNQFYALRDIGEFKIDALSNMIRLCSETIINPYCKYYTNQKLKETVIVTTDSMESRKIVWEQFKKQSQCLNFIEARMGAEEGRVYCISKINKCKHKNCDSPFCATLSYVSKEDIKFYESNWYPDSEVPPVKCTEKTIIYNVLYISSLICRSFKGIINEEKFPREIVFGLGSLHNNCFMVRK